MSSKIPLFGTSIKSELLGSSSSYSLTNKTSNLYKSSSSVNTILDYSAFGTTWIENKNIPSGFSWSSIAISSEQLAATKTLIVNPNDPLNRNPVYKYIDATFYGQYQSVTFENNTKNIVAIFYSHNIGRTWKQVKRTDVDLSGNELEPLYKWTNLKMSVDGKTQIVVANDKYLFRSSNYGVNWILDIDIYNNLKTNKINNLNSISMNQTGTIIYIAGKNQPTYTWRNSDNVISNMATIKSCTESDATIAYNALKNYSQNTSNVDTSIYYYYYNIISDAVNISYTINNKVISANMNKIIIDTTKLFSDKNVEITYTPKMNNQYNIISGWNTDNTNYNNSAIGCSNDGFFVTTVTQTNYPYKNTLMITTNNTLYLSTDIIISGSTLQKSTLLNSNTHFFELNTPIQRDFKIAISNNGQYQTIVVLNTEKMKTTSVNSHTGILYSNDFGSTWQYATYLNTISIEFLQKINWTSIAISYTGQYQTATSAPSYINTNGYIYYSFDYGKSWTQSSGKTGAPSKYWTGVSIIQNNTNFIDNSIFATPEGYIQVAISKDRKIYISKFYKGSDFIKDQINGGALDITQITVELDDTSYSQNTIVN